MFTRYLICLNGMKIVYGVIDIYKYVNGWIQISIVKELPETIITLQ